MDVATLTAELVRVPSLTGGERPAVEATARIAAELGLEARVVEEDLAAARAHPAWPGAEVPRTELLTAEVVRPGDGERIALCGHLDVVTLGTEPWSFDPWGGTIADGRVHGRGAVDMKGAVAAALLAMASAPPGPEVVLLAVSSEEDGGSGAFAALERDAAFDAALVLEPTGFDVCCAQAGALTFTGRIPGVAAHAAARLEGVSALDRYVRVHAALTAHERRLNTGVRDPLMATLPLPYPLSVGRIAGGEWPSSVPDLVEFEGRVGVRIGEDPGEARAAFEAAVAAACPEADVAWTGGQFASGATDPGHPWARRVLAASGGAAVGVAYGADMRHFTAKGVPTVMCGTPGFERAHAVDEYVEIADIERLVEVVREAIIPA
jgi:acetylornithine deacetylase